MRPPVSLHVSLAPGDLPHARHLLPHQLRVVAPLVAEVVLTVDGGPESAPDLGPFLSLATPFRATCEAWQVRAADHSEGHRRALGRRVFGLDRPLPHRTYRRGPCLSYFDGWAAASHPYLFHLDSDMLLGGDLGAWLASSLRLLEQDPRVFACNPLPGPPRADGTLNQSDLGAHPALTGSHCFRGLSTRIFLARRADLVQPSPPLPWRAATLRSRLRAHLDGLPRLDLPENLFTRRMLTLGLLRVDHGGTGRPAFSLHPPHRNAEFYRRLPELVARTEADDFPADQRGCYDVNSSLIDWSAQIAALETRRWWRVLLARARRR
jgi:hypothetical protein